MAASFSLSSDSKQSQSQARVLADLGYPLAGCTPCHRGAWGTSSPKPKYHPD